MFGLNQGFDVYDDRMPEPDPRKSTLENPSLRAGEVVDRAVGWLERQSGTAPFFLWVHVYDPHAPFDPPAPFDSQYAGRPYDGEVAYTDREMGRLFEAVGRKSPAEKTATAGVVRSRREPGRTWRIFSRGLSLRFDSENSLADGGARTSGGKASD